MSLKPTTPRFSKSYRPVLGALFSLAACLPVSTATAQDAAVAQPSDAPELESMVAVGRFLYSDQVNALRSPTPIVDVPQSLSILTIDQITKQGLNSIGDIIDYTPGVNNSQGEGHRDAVVFRGVRSTADFFIDGVRDDVQYYRPLYNLEQIEILRGPNALLFGRGGTGGILNRVTKKGVIGENFSAYQTSIDSFGEFSAQFDSNQAIGENLAFRINALFEDLANHRDHYDGERIGLNPKVTFQVSEDTRLDFSYEYIDHSRYIDRGIPTGADGRPVEALEDVVFGDTELNETQLEAHVFRAMAQHAFSDDVKGNISAFYGDYDKLYQNFFPTAYDPVTNIVTLDGYIDTTQRSSLILSANLVGEFTTGNFGHTVVTGVEYIDTDNDNDRFNSFWDQTQDDTESFFAVRDLGIANGVGVNAAGQTTTNDFSVDLNDQTEATVEVFSAYFQDEIEISEKLDLIVGARFDSFEIEVLNVPAAETRSRRDEEVSPRLGLVFKPQENISIYGSYSESFLPRSGEQFANINGNNNALDPNTFTNSEIGLKWDISDDLSLSFAAFEIEQSSPQVADNDPSTLDVIDTEITGFEAQLFGNITDVWFVTAGYSYLDGEQVNRSGPTGLRPRELPEHMFSVWTKYKLTEKFGLGLGMTYQDESFINNSNSALLPSYTRVDAAAFYDFSEDFRIQVNIENLTDRLYFPHAHSTHQASVGAPINARLTISGRF